MTKDEQWLLREKYNGIKTEEFLADCERLAAGEPLGYVIGFVPFLDCQIWLDSRPLIPRPETEYWTEQVIKSLQLTLPRQGLGPALGLASGGVRGRTPYLQVLDLCAGSGAIGVAVAKAVPEVEVTFVELDSNHLPTIEKNLTENTFIYESISHQVIQSDLFAAFREMGTPPVFDFILTNPPYIDKAANTVEESVTIHEPHLALFGGTHGMEIIERIIKEAPSFLAPQGQLWIEHEPLQAAAIHELATTHGYIATHHPDQYDTVRYSVLVKNVTK